MNRLNITLCPENAARFMDTLSRKTVFAGFDGFIDHIYKVVEGSSGGADTFFPDMGRFARYLIDKGAACSLEIREQRRKIGGNMPIFANALGCCGVAVECAGAVGGEGGELFRREMHPNCRLHPISPPGVTYALEFGTGKLMLCENEEIGRMDYCALVRGIGEDAIRRFIRGSDLVALLNWGELPLVSDIWDHIVWDILPDLVSDKNRILFMDLSDFSNRAADMSALIGHMEQFSRYFYTVLSVNDNECRLLAGSAGVSDIRELARYVYGNLSLDELVLHSLGFARCYNGNGVFEQEQEIVKSPALTTGAGDNFNAGYCVGKLLGLDEAGCLTAGARAAVFYVREGRGAELGDLLR